MKEYIEREAVLRIIDKYGCGDGSILGYHSGAVDCAGSEIARIPSADVAEVRHGRWIPRGDDDSDAGMYKCSECSDERYFGEEVWTSEEAATYAGYCPNCGALMDKEE